MGASSFNEMELDAIGEIMNISLGASATAVSTMLGTKVNITTPVVLVQTRAEFEFKRRGNLLRRGIGRYEHYDVPQGGYSNYCWNHDGSGFVRRCL